MELLYNGIKLPDEWPPRNMAAESDYPMPVPYLENPPDVIPINVGRQLFVDDFLIAENSMEQVFHKPEKYSCNPVLVPETDEEIKYLPSIGLLQGGVFFNPGENRFEMFYHAGHLVESRSLHFAVSQDMINWERIDVGLGHGNMFLKPGGWMGFKRQTAGTAFAVWLDLDAHNHMERYKMLSFWGHREPKPPNGMTHSLHISEDGIHWSDAVLAGKAEDAQSLFYNPFRKVWVCSIKRPIRRKGHSLRARWYIESDDFMKGHNWDDAVYWTCTDRLDLPEPEDGYPPYPFHGEPCQLYLLHGTPYESIMLGMHEIYRGPDNSICKEGKFPKLVDLELGFSRDGFHWHRPDRSGFIRASRQQGSWDRAYLHSTTSVCVILKDEIIFPYAGFSGFDPDGNPGHYSGGSIGIAKLRRDGFASMCAGDDERTLLTRPVIFKGEYFFVNLDNIRGRLFVEVCSESGEPLAGFSREDCLPLIENSTKKLVCWKGGQSLRAFANKPVRFRFYLTRGELYAFWVSSSKEGRSGGYVAGGSPDHAGIKDE